MYNSKVFSTIFLMLVMNVCSLNIGYSIANDSANDKLQKERKAFLRKESRNLEESREVVEAMAEDLKIIKRIITKGGR